LKTVLVLLLVIFAIGLVLFLSQQISRKDKNFDSNSKAAPRVDPGSGSSQFQKLNYMMDQLHQKQQEIIRRIR